MSQPYLSSVCLSPATPGDCSNVEPVFLAQKSPNNESKERTTMVMKTDGGESDWSGTLSPPEVAYKGNSSMPSPSTGQPPSLTLQGSEPVRVAVHKGKDEEICLICGDRASGYHYNALSCEGCKGFFRRSITRNANYECKYGGNCEMDMWMRRRCQACRLKRCREVGMKEECLLSDEQCRARDVRRKARQVMQGTRRTFQNTEEFLGHQSIITPPQSLDDESGTTVNPLDRVSESTKDLIRKLVYYQDIYELPKEEDIKNMQNMKVSDIGRPKEMSQQVYQHMAEMTLLVTQLVVECAKKMPGFIDLDKDDQITLLKGSSCEVMMLRTARRYDLDTNTVVFGDGVPFTKDSLKYAGLGSYADSMFNFCHGMALLGVDNAEYALLTALCIFTDRPGLVNERHVDHVQDKYVNALIEYVKCRRPQGPYLARLLMKLTHLRQLSVEHSDMLFNLKVEKGSLPPLLSEYFDVLG